MTKNYNAEWEEQGSAPSNPSTGSWKIYPKSTGMFILEDDGTEHGPINTVTVNAIGSIGGGTQDIDLDDGRAVSATVDTSETTFTFSNPRASGQKDSFILVLTNGGSQTVNWPGSVDWAGGTGPSLTASGVDILRFITIDGGTIWYGFALGLDMQ